MGGWISGIEPRVMVPAIFEVVAGCNLAMEWNLRCDELWWSGSGM